MEFSIREGLQYTSSKKITEHDTAAYLGSGMLDVYATPAMVALMENAAMLSVAAHIPDNMNTVGVAMDVEHIKASAVGTKVSATAILSKMEGRRLFFLIKVVDEYGEIGRGFHVRVVIEKDKFMSKLNR